MSKCAVIRILYRGPHHLFPCVFYCFFLFFSTCGSQVYILTTFVLNSYVSFVSIINTDEVYLQT